MKKLILIMISVFMFASCSLIQKTTNTTSVCDNLTEESMLCEIANKHNVSIEKVGKLIRLANAGAITSDVYTAKEALNVLEDIKKSLESPVSYAFVKTKLNNIYKKYPLIFIVMTEYISELNSTQIMYSYDQELLTNWIDSLIAEMNFIISIQD